MNIKIALITSAALFALLTAPASARIDGDEGGLSAYPRFSNERSWWSETRQQSDILINRPSHQR